MIEFGEVDMIFYDITEEDKSLIEVANLVKVGIKDLLPFACL